MSDVLNRLRSVQNDGVQYLTGSDIMRDAADEIERDRQRIRELEAGLRDVLDYAQDCAAINDERPPCLESAKKLLEQKQ